MDMENEDCEAYGCLDLSLNDDQRAKAHVSHLLEIQRSNLPKMAFCDIGHKDKTHHTNVYCKVMERNRAVGHVYAPKTNKRVILGLFPKPCPECDNVR